MTVFLDNLAEIFDEFDVAVLDQWGVLHNGTTPYPDAIAAIRSLQEAGKPIAVVSNSGKRAALNAERIRRIGIPIPRETVVVTSGEALWEDLRSGRLAFDGRVPKFIFAVCAKRSDAIEWAEGVVDVRHHVDDDVDAVLVMGLPDRTAVESCDQTLRQAMDRGLPLICSNPDRSSPRSDGLVTSPGAVAERYAEMGGNVIWYGKPYPAIYRSLLRAFPKVERSRFLMVGDSLEHDIAGAAATGFRSVLIRGGIHREDFATCEDPAGTLDTLIGETGRPRPDFCLELFR